MKNRKLWIGETNRFARLRAIEKLDPQQDYLEISRLFYGDFRSIMMPLPFAGFMTTFAAPRMSRILSKTGELESRFAKRAVDTMLFSKLVSSNGFGSGQGRDAARRVNQLHSKYDIHPDDFTLVGCDPALYALHLAETFGWRDVTDKEREAVRIFYALEARAFGAKRPLPGTIDEMKAFVSNYFDTHLYFEPQNQRMANNAVNWYADLAPKPLRGVMRKVLPALIDKRVVQACGLPRPSLADRAAAKIVMSVLSRLDPVADGASDLTEKLSRKVYPDGWSVEMLGPQDAEASRIKETDSSDAKGKIAA